ncbi:YciI family protein [Caballeronia sp. LP003]|uniref:YciI family protein n=1 Tax=Caballeronia sp. LP003 TaxID=3038551 RepID=UPI003857F016
MEHPDGQGWDQNVLAHVEYLRELIDGGRLLASGPLKGTRLRSGFLIMIAESRQEVEEAVKDDPFSKEGLISSLSIEEWDPLFGALADWSSQTLPAVLTGSGPQSPVP